MIEVDDARLVLVEAQTPGRQPRRQPFLDLFGLLTTVTQGDKIICVPHHYGTAPQRLTGMSTGLLAADPGSVLQSVQGHIQQQGTDHSTLCAVPGYA